LKLLRDAVAEKVKTQGYLVGLDGRRLDSRSPHSALNLLLQSAGALVMKRAMVDLYKSLGASQDIHKRNTFIVVNVHDEIQILVREGEEERIGNLAVQKIKEAGESFRLRCPLSGEWKAGNSWARTH
jgi:DNA polymerase I-like protein with 3'-5' exonuclease and polymerase domains